MWYEPSYWIAAYYSHTKSNFKQKMLMPCVCLFYPLINRHAHLIHMVHYVESIIFILINYYKPGLMKQYILMTGSDLNCSGPVGLNELRMTFPLRLLLVFFLFLWILHSSEWSSVTWRLNHFAFRKEAAFDLPMWRGIDVKALPFTW